MLSEKMNACASKPAGAANSPALFKSLRLRKLSLANRIVVSPMCQYSAQHGNVNEWHLQHLTSLSMSGAGLVVIEAMDVDPVGAFTTACLSLHSDENERALSNLVDVCHRYGSAALGLQLTHAGRKAACHVPWQHDGKPLSASDGAWQTVAPSAIPYGPGWATPQALDRAGLAGIRRAFAASARRAARAGLDSLELHGAHGYLLHQFLSPLSNQRTDIYGGGPEQRMRFPLEVFEAVREAWPGDRPLGMRISGNDWVEGGETPDTAVEFAKRLRALDCDFVCVSGGGLVPYADIKVAPGYQVPFAAKVRAEAGIVVRAVGLISDAQQAENIVAAGQADLVALARAFLDDPRWGWHAAAELGANLRYPPPYERCHYTLWSGHKRFRAGEAYYKTTRFLPRGLGS